MWASAPTQVSGQVNMSLTLSPDGFMARLSVDTRYPQGQSPRAIPMNKHQIEDLNYEEYPTNVE
ncbi:hypothetical protein DU505_07255 [Billgrantia montanilacus]|uniref:Uncharacterized protein n=1 Tax=Billgrantia montanilacus TaxID=2282305 RepID=A0A368U0M6_9GAMM|nr:hypothetical protein DU505_07255 [Halomonas montanilacus]